MDEVVGFVADGRVGLVIPPLSAEDVPAEATELKAELAGMLPFAPIASLLIELDYRTGFLSCFAHAGGRKQAMSGELKRNILSVVFTLNLPAGPSRPPPAADSAPRLCSCHQPQSY